MNQNQEELLKKYREYDYLNVGKNNPLVKIFVGYIKPSFLFKSEILTPIHLGRAVEKDDSKDGIQNDENLKWLHKNCIGDNDFDGNISHINRRVGFLTGTYWAWKNYEKLGNPEYFGSFGYRKLLSSDCLDDLEKYDLIVPEQTTFKTTLKEQFINFHGENLYTATIDIIKLFFPDELEDVEKYFNQNSGYFYELYIMKKEIFISFCEWIFKFLFSFIKIFPSGIEINQKALKNRENFCKFLEISKEDFQVLLPQEKQGKELRDLGFIIERVTGYYLHKLTKQNNRYKKSKVIDYTPKSNDTIAKKLILEKMRQNIKMSIK